MTERIMMLEKSVHDRDEIISTFTTERRVIDDVQAGVHQHLNPSVTVDQPPVALYVPPPGGKYYS